MPPKSLTRPVAVGCDTPSCRSTSLAETTDWEVLIQRCANRLTVPARPCQSKADPTDHRGGYTRNLPRSAGVQFCGARWRRQRVARR